MANTIDAHIGKNIRERRTELGLSREDVATATALDLAAIEAGQRRAGAADLFVLCRVLRMPVSRLLLGLAATLNHPAAR